MSEIEARINRMGIVLPNPPAPVASYVPFIRIGDMIHISGQVSRGATGDQLGKLGGDLSLEQGQAAARVCGLNLLAQLKVACDGNLDRLVQVIKLNGFVNVMADFDSIPQVMNGCSDLMVEVLGEAGKHARSAVGVANLPMGFAVEVDGIFQITSF
ncbi:RidA family protein [Candidatus Phycosocius spiralis]|uniref:Endoribonuclease L-PSP/chorismate mutase-like domain-containing protein n=1 Tax=Candidatus Phycosocius spiralis TaxID=2815099 RepID=A0ABQ4PT37_9PROT|nr:RidA family protein [Candidatus Phycosocius spiralis]GIU66165.1 hypothetical protein PsB1_0319 [Candidatus Phycosocius spiralis]